MLDDARIDSIVQHVMSELQQGERVRHGPAPDPQSILKPSGPAPTLKSGDNLFSDVESAVVAARRAFVQLKSQI